MYRYIIAIDPGGTSGIAIRAPDGKLSTTKVQTQEDLWALFLPNEPRPDHIIIEEWTFRTAAATPPGIMTCEIVASIKGICYVLGIPLSIRTPGARNIRMEEATKWYTQSRRRKTFSKFESHEIDALAHLLAWESAN